jgi:hypothetical protein
MIRRKRRERNNGLCVDDNKVLIRLEALKQKERERERGRLSSSCSQTPINNKEPPSFI